jgi:hypothetical protein
MPNGGARCNRAGAGNNRGQHVAGQLRALISNRKKAMADEDPYLIAIDVPKDSESGPWPFIHPAKQ